MIPLRSALRSSGPSASSSTSAAAAAAAAACRRCRPTTPSILPLARLASTSTSTSRPISHYLPPSRSIHTSPRLLKDKKWLNHADEAEAEAELKKQDQDGEVEEAGERSTTTTTNAPEGSEAESSKTASDRAASIAAESSSSSSSSSGTASASASGSSSGNGNGNGDNSDSSSAPPPPPKSTGREIAKPSIPETYPQVLALPITRRPLFPGFYKAVTITSPAVIKAIRELLAHGQPYIGAFLLKDSNSDSDVITSMDQVHPVGVFAQITSVFGSTATEGGAGKDGKEGADVAAGEGKPETLTAVLYPHRRIRIDELITSPPPPSTTTTTAPASQAQSVPVADVVDEVHRQEVEQEDEGEGEVASFETEVPSVDAVKEKLDPEGMSLHPPRSH